MAMIFMAMTAVTLPVLLRRQVQPRTDRAVPQLSIGE
jgi:uncharacterized membrane protein